MEGGVACGHVTIGAHTQPSRRVAVNSEGGGGVPLGFAGLRMQAMLTCSECVCVRVLPEVTVTVSSFENCPRVW